MIFITLGSQKFQFNRLLKAIDKLVEDGVINEEVFAQIGFSDYEPVHYKFEKFLDRDKFAATMAGADVVITHGGTGAIINAVKQGKKVVAVPRLAKYGEHVDDHQIQLISQFRNLNLICECRDCEDLADAIVRARNTEYDGYESNTDKILNDIDSYIESL